MKKEKKEKREKKEKSRGGIWVGSKWQLEKMGAIFLSPMNAWLEGRQLEDHTEFRCVTRDERKWLTIISDGDSTVGGRSLLNTPLSFDVSVITDKNLSGSAALLFFFLLFFPPFVSRALPTFSSGPATVSNLRPRQPFASRGTNSLTVRSALINF